MGYQAFGGLPSTQETFGSVVFLAIPVVSEFWPWFSHELYISGLRRQCYPTMMSLLYLSSAALEAEPETMRHIVLPSLMLSGLWHCRTGIVIWKLFGKYFATSTLGYCSLPLPSPCRCPFESNDCCIPTYRWSRWNCVTCKGVLPSGAKPVRLNPTLLSHPYSSIFTRWYDWKSDNLWRDLITIGKLSII